jgi:Ca2+-binding RTX toxin-like protein
MVTFVANIRRRRSTLLCTVAGALAAAFLAPAAWPATASVVSGGFLTYQAAPGEANNVTASRSTTGTVTITDLGAIIVAGSGCNAVTDHEVQCPAIRETWLNLYDLDDTSTSTGRTFTVEGGPGADTITGSFDFFHVAFGGTGNDTLIGGPSFDVLWGQAGADSLIGHEGDDDLQGGQGDDDLDGGPGSDRTDMHNAPAPVRIDLPAGIATGHGNDSLISIEDAHGSRHGDVFIGNAKANLFFGWTGPDVAYGAGGPDFLSGDDGADLLRGGPGSDTLLGGQGPDLLRGDLGRDKHLGGPGPDYLRARDGRRDALNGGRGIDRAKRDSIDAVTGVERF